MRTAVEGHPPSNGTGSDESELSLLVSGMQPVSNPQQRGRAGSDGLRWARPPTCGPARACAGVVAACLYLVGMRVLFCSLVTLRVSEAAFDSRSGLAHLNAHHFSCVCAGVLLTAFSGSLSRHTLLAIIVGTLQLVRPLTSS